MHEARQGYMLDRAAKPATSPNGVEDRKVKIVFEGDDYLKCNPFNTDGSVDDTEDIYVMKPWSFRRTLWDGTGPDQDGVSYVYSTASARTATIGPITEQQRITSSYADGKVIYAKLGSEVFTLTNGKKTQWSDVNRDGRAWAHLGI